MLMAEWWTRLYGAFMRQGRHGSGDAVGKVADGTLLFRAGFALGFRIKTRGRA